MSEVFAVSEREADDLSPGILRATSLEVARAKNQHALVLSVGVFLHAKPDGNTMEFALTPPAAHQLAHQLKKAVKDYLRSELEKE